MWTEVRMNGGSVVLWRRERPGRKGAVLSRRFQPTPQQEVATEGHERREPERADWCVASIIIPQVPPRYIPTLHVLTFLTYLGTTVR